ncbi:MAG: PilT/PilU family type 4a pilus ATPase [Candidatus Pacebacteria bacterium]|nr:PilT/PilU family type 4a pilus ATPase [Candidatus Paceibacterota bacterium]
MDPKQELNSLIETAVQQDGSDIHIGVGRYPSLRVTGELVQLVKHTPHTKEMVLGILSELLLHNETKINAFLSEQEVDFSFDYEGKVRLRGNAFFTKGNISIALRIIPKVRTLEDLALPAILNEFASRRQGFFLVVGPVGQGKSTTMAAMVDHINTERAEHIVTIEDPIEYLHEPKRSIIDQREVGIDSKSFESALKSVFREDVNVILIGEMRSAETIATAVTAAETGHLVISTLHTNNAAQTIDRIIDAFPGNQQDQIRVQLASSLIGIFSQRLIPKTTGGLVPAYELLINNAAVANLIRERRTHEIGVVIETGFGDGMIDMNRSLLDLVRRGEITMEKAFAHSINPKALERLV